MQHDSNTHTEFDHIPSPEELMQTFSQSECTDPRLKDYKRVLVRPKLNAMRALLHVMIALAIAAIVGALVFAITKSHMYAWLSSGACVLLALCIFAKRIAIWLVMAYQRLAPESVRRNCRYEPSCSQYMILSIKKYGFFKGITKGFKRLVSCKPPNGGFDPP